MSGLKGELSEGSNALTRQPDYFETMAVVLEEITDLPWELIPSEIEASFCT